MLVQCLYHVVRCFIIDIIDRFLCDIAMPHKKDMSLPVQRTWPYN